MKEEAGPAEEHGGDDLEQGERGMEVTYSPPHPYSTAVVPFNWERGAGEGRGGTIAPTGGGAERNGRAGSPLVGGSARAAACVVVVAMTLIPSNAAQHR